MIAICNAVFSRYAKYAKGYLLQDREKGDGVVGCSTDVS